MKMKHKIQENQIKEIQEQINYIPEHKLINVLHDEMLNLQYVVPIEFWDTIKFHAEICYKIPGMCKLFARYKTYN